MYLAIIYYFVPHSTSVKTTCKDRKSKYESFTKIVGHSSVIACLFPGYICIPFDIVCIKIKIPIILIY